MKTYIYPKTEFIELLPDNVLASTSQKGDKLNPSNNGEVTGDV